MQDRSSDLRQIIESLQQQSKIHASGAATNKSGITHNGDIKLSSPHSPLIKNDHINKSVSPSNTSPAAELLAQQQQFTEAVRRATHTIHWTCTQLQSLSQLVHRFTIFDDKTAEIEAKSAEIKRVMAQLVESITDLDGMNRAFSASHQRGSAGGAVRQQQLHRTKVLETLQCRVTSMSSEFNELLEVRMQALTKQSSRRKTLDAAANHIHANGNSQPNAHAQFQSHTHTQRHHAVQPSFLLEDEARANHDASSTPFNQQQSMSQQQAVALPDTTNEFLESRSEAISQIEHTILDMGQMMQQIAQMVAEQGEASDRIAQHVEVAELNVEAAHSELTKYLRSITNNRWLMAKVFGIVFFFFVLFVVFIA